MSDLFARLPRLPRRLWSLAFLLLALLLPLALDNYLLAVLWQAGIYVLLALGLTIIVGYAGLFQLGQAAFYAIGAYTAAILNLYFGAPIILGLPVAVILAGGLTGAAVAFLGQTFATVVDYPLNIGGRPLFSWPAYIPITFELGVLLAATAGVLALFALTRFPQPYHPVFRSDDFNAHASQDGFYLSIEASDPQFDLEATRRFLQEAGSTLITELEA
jgi:ABC-type branched-subunit amino acid transport system permease subunit